MNSLQTNYQALVSDENEVPLESVIFHVAAENAKTRWNHVGDLDAFFRRIYNFHQKRGYLCILVEHAIWVILFILIAFGFIYCLNCIYFTFHDPPSPLFNKTDIEIPELFIPISVCAANYFGFWSWFLVVICTIVVVYRMYKFICNSYTYKEIQQFYESAMKISKTETQNITWHEVQCKLREVQHEQQMCVQSHDLTELNISHRILRYRNYMVALVNKNVLPLKFNIKYLGEWAYLSSTLEYMIELLLFTSVTSPFGGTGKLREEYKKNTTRQEAAAELSKYIFWYGVLSLVFFPFIFFWTLLSFLISYSGFLRFEPAILTKRRWSNYSRLYLRHFNELDHELNARLCRAYKPSTEYMKCFSSPLLAIIIKFVSQTVGFFVVFFMVWGLFAERLFTVPHILLIISCGTTLFIGLASCVPDENEVFDPNNLMQKIVSDIHYIPDHFKKLAHTTKVRDEFSHHFQYVMIFLFEELISPFITPYILICHLRHRTLEIVDFFRNFTVEVQGVGDVCSFALMDVSRHGDPQLMNPNWEPPPSSNVFLDGFKEQAQSAKQHYSTPGDNPFYASLNSLSSMGSKYASLVTSVHQSVHEAQSHSGGFVISAVPRERVHMKGLNQAEGPPYLHNGILTSDMEVPTLQSGLNPLEIRAADMSLSALFLHEVHDKYVESSQGDTRSQSVPPEQENGNEQEPLLDVRRTNYVQ